jgi:hypothetical protein
MGIPKLTKEEYVRFELAKACIAARPRDGANAIASDIITLADGVLHPEKVQPWTGPTGDAKKA